ncbi:hypothetical protein [Thermomonospora umbrina]|uniref:hypothetical protein n=1 Tax=Thermomonospora umbrina TaxID=111806 RepID=UPI001B871AAC|nr:hypothetical protein [Thermomonospora umbrina]
MSVLVTVVYALLVVPVGLVVRLVRDPLRRTPDPAADTYWTYEEGGPPRPPGAGRRRA